MPHARRATISAWAVGSLVRITEFWPCAMNLAIRGRRRRQSGPRRLPLTGGLLRAQLALLRDRRSWPTWYGKTGRQESRCFVTKGVGAFPAQRPHNESREAIAYGARVAAGSCSAACRGPRRDRRQWMPMTSRSGKELGEDAERDAVVRIVEGRDQDEAVGDVEVGVAGGQALVGERRRARASAVRQCVNCLPSCVRAALRRARFSASGSWLGSLDVRLDGSDDCGRVDEAGDVVDVAVGVVAGDAAVRARAPGRCRGSR